MSQGKIDFKRIKETALRHSEELLHKWLPDGYKEGLEWVCKCPFHSDKSPSFKVNLKRGVWFCFGCEAGKKDGGDLIALYAKLNGMTNGEAAKALGDYFSLGGALNMGTPAPEVAATKKTNQEWLPIVPVPADVPEPNTFADWHYGEPEKVWTYRGASGELLGYVRRFKKTTPKEDGSFGKEIKPLVWAYHDGKKEYAWRPLSFPKPRPLYGLDKLAKRPNEGVCIVEGEKAADAGQTIVPGVTVSWPGGGKAVKHTDWTPLKGRRVLIWPDRDRHPYKEGKEPSPELAGVEMPPHEQEGYKTAIAIAQALEGIAESVRIIEGPEGVADGWDVADALEEGWDKKRVVGHIKKRLEEQTPPPALPPPGKQEPEIAAEFSGPQPPQPNQKKQRAGSDWPFYILGHERGDFFYLPKLSKQVVKLSARSHVKNEFLTLAPLDWWEEKFPGQGDGGAVNWLAAANSLMQRALPREFDADSIRGRGAWLDNGDVVYHAGDRLILNGDQEADIESADGRFVYERGRRLDFEKVKPATPEEASKLVKLCQMLSLKNKIDAAFLAGWIATGPICGVLKWRAHCWITGAAGTGKSTVINDIVKPMLGKTALVVQGATTEAGIRQRLQRDALPVLFDEAESEERKDMDRIQSILNLMRAASSDSDGVIAKGTANGDGNSYIIRSAFCLASIGVGAHRRADRSRITMIEMVKNEDRASAESHYAEIKRTITETVWSPGFCESIRARCLLLAPTIVKNAATLSTVAARYLGSQRDGDQVGTLLAGAYALTSDEVITPEAADKFCARQDWSPWKFESHDMDEHRAYSHLMEAIVMHEEEDHNYRLSIAELVRDAYNPLNGTHANCKETLERYGIGIRKSGVDVSTSNSELRRIFDNTPFAGKWADQLKRLSGATMIANSFFNGVQNRAVRLPREMFSRSGDVTE